MIDINNINLQIENVDFWKGGLNLRNRGGMRIYWSSSIGFGTLDIVKNSGRDGDDFESPFEEIKFIASTECMDSNDDKAFTKKILSLLAEELEIVD